MTAADLADVVALEQELFPEDPWTPEMFADEVVAAAPSRLYLVAEADTAESACGYAGMMFVPGGPQADVLTIAVRPSPLGPGDSARRCSDALVDAARERGCAEVFLEVRADNPAGARRSTCGAGSRRSASAGATTSRPGWTRS